MRFDIACSLRCLFHCSRRPGQFPGKMISCRLLVVVPAGHIVAMFLQATWYTIYRVKSVSECCVETSISYRQVKASGKKREMPGRNGPVVEQQDPWQMEGERRMKYGKSYDYVQSFSKS